VTLALGHVLLPLPRLTLDGYPFVNFCSVCAARAYSVPAADFGNRLLLVPTIYPLLFMCFLPVDPVQESQDFDGAFVRVIFPCVSFPVAHKDGAVGMARSLKTSSLCAFPSLPLPTCFFAVEDFWGFRLEASRRGWSPCLLRVFRLRVLPGIVCSFFFNATLSPPASSSRPSSSLSYLFFFSICSLASFLGATSIWRRLFHAGFPVKGFLIAFFARIGCEVSVLRNVLAFTPTPLFFLCRGQ